MKIYKLWDLKPGSLLKVGGDIYLFTTIPRLLEAFKSIGSTKMLKILEQAAFIKEDGGVFKLLPFNKKED